MLKSSLRGPFVGITILTVILMFALAVPAGVQANGLRHVFKVDEESLSIAIPRRLCVFDRPETLPIKDLQHRMDRIGVQISLILVDCRDVDKIPNLGPGDTFDAVIVAPMKVFGRAIRTGSTEAAALSLYLRQFMTLKPDVQKKLLIDGVGAQLLQQSGLQADAAETQSLHIVPGKSEPHIRGALKLGQAGIAHGTATFAPLGVNMGAFISVSGNRPTDLDRMQQELDGIALSVAD